MILKKASRQAVNYALLNFHYAKTVAPRAHDNAYSVFNSKGEWCGVICFGMGATPQIGSPYNLKQGEAVELIRVALNGKQEVTSKVVALGLRLLKKHSPLVKLVVSYADKGQQHNGTIYQATNWYFVGSSVSSGIEYYVQGKWRHAKSIKPQIKKIAKKRKSSGKNKYLFPLDKSLLPLCKSLSKPYPKKAVEVHELNTLHSSKEVGGANPTQPL
tara:strand:- start:253 stop:897 length:645 start_codon:yes stop_codon:yes gene_type:complete